MTTSWKINYAEGKSFEEGQAATKHVIAVAALLNSDTWDVARPNSGPACLAAWVAVLRAQDAKNDPVKEFAAVVELPFSTLIGMLEME